VLSADRAIVHVAFNGENVVGDRENGKLYALDLDYYTDDGDYITSLRQTPHTSEMNAIMRFWEVWIDVENGVGLDGGVFGSDPQALLQWSDDYGHTFVDGRFGSLGKIGERKTRLRWTRLGSGRDRVWRITITDPVKRIIIAAGMRADVAAA
jgi:hypothetical protein